MKFSRRVCALTFLGAVLFAGCTDKKAEEPVTPAVEPTNDDATLSAPEAPAAVEAPAPVEKETKKAAKKAGKKAATKKKN